MTHDQIIRQIEAVPLRGGRRIVAVAGAPASGKSTLAEQLADQIPNASVVPMDGFHLDNAALEQIGLLHRKGAPDTFDAAGFVQMVRDLRSTSEITYPTFDRSNDCVVPQGGRLAASVETVIVEGNYLLLTRAPWDALAAEWDLSIMIEVPFDVLQSRLIERWQAHGLDLPAATARAQSNDIPNAELVVTQSSRADLTL